MKETAAKVTAEVASRTRAGRAAEQLKKEWEIAAVGLPKVRLFPVVRTGVLKLHFPVAATLALLVPVPI